jgi:hypothetical protein
MVDQIGGLMSSYLLAMLVSAALIAPSMASDAPVAVPTPAASAPAASAPATPAAASGPDSVVVFGTISLSADHKILTLTDGKGVKTKLVITAKTDATIDLHKADVTSISTTQTVRVMYTGDKVDSIDQLTPDKKKKKLP